MKKPEDLRRFLIKEPISVAGLHMSKTALVGDAEANLLRQEMTRRNCTLDEVVLELMGNVSESTLKQLRDAVDYFTDPL